MPPFAKLRIDASGDGSVEAVGSSTASDAAHRGAPAHRGRTWASPDVRVVTPM
jgi:hypothetical protein